MSTRTGGLGGNDIWLSQRATLSAPWGPAQNLNVLNTSDSEAPGSISPDGREMIFNSNRAGGLGGADLWRTTRTDPGNDLGWTTPVHLGSVVNTAFGEQTPTYFVDPATGAGTLYFSSDRDSGTTNVKDIYQSTRNADGTFNTPTAISVLNSTADDNRPAISPNGLEMYFSTNRTGTRTILVSTRASTASQWNPPVPVGALNDGGLATQPSLSADGSILYFTSDRAGALGTGDIYSAVRVAVNRIPSADFDGDGRTDLSVYRPSDGSWWVKNSGAGTTSVRPFGATGDRAVPGDYDGDGRIDIAIFRPSTGHWWITRSSDGVVTVVNWGLSTDRPAPGDYDGDGRTDVAVYRDGAWYILQSSNGSFKFDLFGLSGDIPLTVAGQ